MCCTTGPASSPVHVAGPLNGNLYAQVDKELKTKIRSLSLDSSARSVSADYINLAGNTSTLPRYRNVQPSQGEGTTLSINNFHFQYPDKMSSSGNMATDDHFSDQIHSIDKLLKELGDCTEFLDSTLQQSRLSKGRANIVSNGEVPGTDENKPSVSERVRFYNTKGLPIGVSPMRAGSFDEGEIRHQQESVHVPAKLARSMSAGQVEMEPLHFTSHKSNSLANRTPSPTGAPLKNYQMARRSPSPGTSSGASRFSPQARNFTEQRSRTLPNGITTVAQVHFQRSGSPNQQRSASPVGSVQSRHRPQSPNIVTTVAQIHQQRPRSPSPKSPDGVLYNAARVVNLSERAVSPTALVCEAPKVHTGPPMSPSSKFYAATQIMPKPYSASTVAHVQAGAPTGHLNGRTDFGLGSSGARLTRDVHVNGQSGHVNNGMQMMDVRSMVNGKQASKEWSKPRSTDLDDGKKGAGVEHSDINNNSNERSKEMTVSDAHRGENGFEECLSQGTVASKVAYLTEITSAVRSPYEYHHHPCRGALVPMPGLSSISPSEVSREIAEYNAKALAPGGLSHCSDTLYVTGAPPKKIIDRTPGKVLTVEPFVSDEFEERVLARRKAGSVMLALIFIFLLGHSFYSYFLHATIRYTVSAPFLYPAHINVNHVYSVSVSIRTPSLPSFSNTPSLLSI